MNYCLAMTGFTGLAGVILLYVYQCKLVYPSSIPEGSREKVALPSEYNMKYSEVTLETSDKIKLKSYIILQEDEKQAKKAPTILYFHANAGNMGHRLPIAKILYNKYNCNIVMLSYRGYGLSEGSPDAKGLKIDSQTMLNYVREHPVLKNTPLIAYGQSIGGAVAIDLVSRNESSFSGLMLENTFLSLHKVIPHVLPFLKHFTFLCHQHWPSEKSIRQIVNVPILFLAGGKDELVPPSHMVQLRDLSESPDKTWVEFPNGMHNDTVMQPGYFTAIRDFLEKLALFVDKEKAKNVLEESYLDGKPVEENDKSYQLISGVTDGEGMAHSFQVEEVVMEE
ncbi:Alpha/Beta hydrolase protein [Sporodiniella umbellata]|nr:Alpha/Beta hydrolase protein [Sporodiniella umbellata]